MIQEGFIQLFQPGNLYQLSPLCQYYAMIRVLSLTVSAFLAASFCRSDLSSITRYGMSSKQKIGYPSKKYPILGQSWMFGTTWLADTSSSLSLESSNFLLHPKQLQEYHEEDSLPTIKDMLIEIIVIPA